MTTHFNIENYIPIVLCAGFGTRLKPLTNFIPKVACPIINKPVAFISIEIFLKAGFQEVHCNTHYLPDFVRSEIINAAIFYGYDPARIIFWHEDEILETGGGIARIYKEISKKSKQNKDAIVVSGDIAANFPLEKMLNAWENKNENDYALMCTKDINYFRKDTTWVSNDSKYIEGFGENFEKKENCLPTVFTTHQIISHKILEQTHIEKISSINLFYRKILQERKNIINFIYPEANYWFDIGTPNDYLKCIQFFSKENATIGHFAKIEVINNCFSNIPIELKTKLVPYQSHKVQGIIIRFASSVSHSIYHLNNKDDEPNTNIFYFIF